MLSYHMENDEEGGVPKMKKMALLLCAVLCICTCTACSMEKETISVAYDLSASPKNIDPQNAEHTGCCHFAAPYYAGALSY